MRRARPTPPKPRPRVLPLLALVAAAPGVARAAQQGEQPTLVLSFGLGAHAGNGGLWAIPRQTLAVLDTLGMPTGAHDTLRLVRRAGTGLVAAFSATYHPTRHLGFQGDVTYLDTGMRSGCSAVSPYAADGAEKNRQLCDDIDGSAATNSTIVFGGGVRLRAAPRGRISPYVRAALGYALHSKGTVAVAGSYYSESNRVLSRQVLADESPKRGSVSGLVGAGLTRRVGPGYQLRLEVRDDLFAFERATGPGANALGQLPTEERWYHHLSLTVSLDVVLERRRGRRY